MLSSYKSLFVCLLLLLSSCAAQVDSPAPESGSSEPDTTNPATPDIPSEAPTSEADEILDSLRPSEPVAKTTTGPTTKVTIYRADSQCTDFLSEPAEVSMDQSLEDTVGAVIAANTNVDFELAGYRVDLDNPGTAVIDFRLDPNSDRQMSSLSSCEQFAIFGSLRETLTRHPDWGIDSVQFTERGKEIVL